MPSLPFTRNDSPTLGVEIELQLVDAQTLELRSAIEPILAALPESLRERVKPELVQSNLEINTGVCRNITEVRRDLTRTLGSLKSVTDAQGVRLLWAATHPFSSWRRQNVTANARYTHLIDMLQDVGRQQITFGLHVHVGVETGDKAVAICNRMLRYLPLLLSLSANSPFWEGRPTGLHSNRSIVTASQPCCGLPNAMKDWSEYTWLVNRLVDTGFIQTIRELWWDIRPHHNFGTVEIRVCDVPRNLDHAIALTALSQSLVVAISQTIDDGVYSAEDHPVLVAENKWRATRYGARAQLVDLHDNCAYGVQETIDILIDRLLPTAQALGCAEELEMCSTLPGQTGAEQQLELYAEHYSRHRVVHEMLAANEWQPS